MLYFRDRGSSPWHRDNMTLEVCNTWEKPWAHKFWSTNMTWKVSPTQSCFRSCLHHRGPGEYMEVRPFIPSAVPWRVSLTEESLWLIQGAVERLHKSQDLHFPSVPGSRKIKGNTFLEILKWNRNTEASLSILRLEYHEWSLTGSLTKATFLNELIRQIRFSEVCQTLEAIMMHYCNVKTRKTEGNCHLGLASFTQRDSLLSQK